MPKRYTDDQIKAAVSESRTKTEAAARLGMGERSLYGRLARMRDDGRWQPPEPPDGMVVKGESTLYDATTGEERLRWVKTGIDGERQREIVAEALTEAARQLPRVKPTVAPTAHDERLMCVYPWGDPHFGMYAWGEETGNDFDLSIARRDLCAAVDHLVSQAPPAKRGVLLNLGDFFHADNMEGITSRSGHVLDMDTRLPKVVRVGVAAVRQCIESALQKHETVDIVNAVGNHDDVLSMVLSVMLANVYEDEPRVIVHDQPTKRHYIEHGKVLIGVTHGHQTKDRDLPGIMAAERSEAWGRTKHRYFYRGHHHHDERLEYNGCMVEQFRTLAAGDAYAVGAGYLAGRDMKCIVHHADYGEVARSVCSIDMLRNP